MNDSTQKSGSWWGRLTGGLKRTSGALGQAISDLVMRGPLSPERIVEIEETLIRADLGVDVAARLATTMGEGRYLNLPEVQVVLAKEIEKVLDPVAKPLVPGAQKPFVMLAAGDTFRAAAIDQLKSWGSRTGAPVVAREAGSDAAGLAFDALAQARREGVDVLLIDSAGRLQNRTELMDELEKIVRVMKKVDASAPHAVLLVLDATVGQNALSQVEVFHKIAGVTGLAMTKLDGTARGGILVAIAAKFGLPVHFIGVGEGIDDLAPFSAGDFARAIAGID